MGKKETIKGKSDAETKVIVSVGHDEDRVVQERFEVERPKRRV